MELTRLLPLLVLLQSLPRLVSSAAPQLTLSPQHPVYIPGETVSLKCSAVGALAMTGIRFLRDGHEIHSRNFTSPREHYTYLTRLSGTSRSQTRVYSCAYWRTEFGQEIPSEMSPPISIAVTAQLPAPKLTLSSPYRILLHGETVTLTCSAPSTPTLSGIQFFKDSQRIDSRELHRSGRSVRASLLLSAVSESQAGAYSCGYWRKESGREISSKRSQPIPIALTDPLPQASLSMNPPSGEVSEGLPLLLTCTAPRDAGERRFHFYKDNVRFAPGEAESEISTTESSIRIPWASLNNTGEFTCGYEENMSGRWIPSLRSQAVTITGNVTVSAPSFLWARELAVGGSFFLINGLIFLVFHCCL